MDKVWECNTEDRSYHMVITKRSDLTYKGVVFLSCQTKDNGIIKNKIVTVHVDGSKIVDSSVFVNDEITSVIEDASRYFTAYCVQNS